MVVVVRHQPRERPRLRQIELHVVAVEIEPLRVRALALATDGPVLPSPVREAEALVPVGVVDRRDRNHPRLQPVNVLALGELAEKDLGRGQRYATSSALKMNA